jgi:hypothetical protein
MHVASGLGRSGITQRQRAFTGSIRGLAARPMASERP